MARLQLQSPEVLANIAGFLDFEDLGNLVQTRKSIYADLTPTVCNSRLGLRKMLQTLKAGLLAAALCMEQAAIREGETELFRTVDRVLDRLDANPLAFLRIIDVDAVAVGRVEVHDLKGLAKPVLNLIIALNRVPHYDAEFVFAHLTDFHEYLCEDPRFYVSQLSHYDPKRKSCDVLKVMLKQVSVAGI